MLASAVIKFKNLLHYILLYFLLMIISFHRYSKKENTLFLVRLDSIGDYILLRNFIRLFKATGKYKNYRITLCGNIIWKDLAETLESDCIDEFIWFDRQKYKSSISYKYNLLKKIRGKGFAAAIDLTYSREILYGDTLVRASNAPEITGSEGSLDSYVKWKRKLFSDKYYTKLIPASKENLFEFYRNKEFFEQLLEAPLNINTTFIDADKIKYDTVLPEKFVVIFPGANENKRKWDLSYFIEVAAFLKDQYSLDIITSGSQKEREIGEIISAALQDKNVYNFAGKTTISQFAKLLSKAEILISNDTGAVHIAAAVKTPFVCISNGNHLGRFHPYPADVFDKAYFIYPPSVMREIHSPGVLMNKYRFNSDLDINTVKPDDVKEIIKKSIKLMNISSIIIAKNEELNIARCISSQISCIDEIVVLVDDSTTDNTFEIVKSFPRVKCELVKWNGYSETKQYAVSLTSNNWILWIDADEALTTGLAAEINLFKESTPSHSAYSMPRIANFLGRWIKHSGWYPGRVTRLFNKNKARFSRSDVHEHLIIDGTVGQFENDIEHYTDPTIHHYFKKFNRYTTLAAKELHIRNKGSNLTDITLRPFFLFIKMYIIKAGFLDGYQGFMLAVFSSAYVFTKYCKLWELKFKGDKKDGAKQQ